MTAVEIVALDAGNIEETLAVSATEDQGAYVRPVAWYVARSAYEQVWSPLAFRANGKIVGFAEWAYDPSDGTHCIGGFVIDAASQGHGLGRHAMTALIDWLRLRPACGPIALSVDAENHRARRLYETLGFAQTADEVDGELVMLLPDEPANGVA